jgi:hypothetical protein
MDGDQNADDATDEYRPLKMCPATALKINVVLARLLLGRGSVNECIAIAAACDLAEAAEERLLHQDVLAVAPPYPMSADHVRELWQARFPR